ncbi:hypothetical protein AVEN_2665-1 [Araneus ventricosus]|uniref:Uncharacterized protein n=1 Tax=Araneus ventricosus TaxID=182803 RepID=A0A4Y2QM50_ARAVE|nr:hypothetical protein AVEN_2665-1 [Araneus ventricosus]
MCIRSLEPCREICQATRRHNGATGRNSTDYSPQVRTSDDSRFAKPHVVGTRLWLTLKPVAPLTKFLGRRTEVCHPLIHKPLMSAHLPTTNGKLRDTPPEQQRSFCSHDGL